MGLVLEAETLIADSLSEEGKQRYIIMDDEFSDSRLVAGFVRRLMKLDAAVHCVFGDPMDIAGNAVGPDGMSLDPHGESVDRRGYVCDRDGRVVFDEQRDHRYTERVAQRLSEAYHRDFVVQSTHLAAWAAWEALRERHQGLDTWRLVRLHPVDLVVDRAAVARHVEHARKKLARQRRAGPGTADAVVEEAITRFATFHKRRAIEPVGDQLRLSPQLVLYYRNRLDGYGISR
jgi:glycerol-3-phosphate O-acyltransferase